MLVVAPFLFLRGVGAHPLRLSVFCVRVVGYDGEYVGAVGFGTLYHPILHFYMKLQLLMLSANKKEKYRKRKKEKRGPYMIVHTKILDK